MRTDNPAAHGAGAKPLHHTREKGTEMFEALMPHPLSPQVDVGDIIVFITFSAVCMFALLKYVTHNGR